MMHTEMFFKIPLSVPCIFFLKVDSFFQVPLFWSVILGYFSFQSLLKGHDLLFVQREGISSQCLIASSSS